ncbi:hypothetical protein AC739_09330 [Planococcus glaciei]|uniref:hypothetical protein n=1 Tax=Planococcus glaciei TaxID=459472 RepID=UPI00069DC480|nr:hypothetical protein [Planococcus glaciei]KOF10539.1 hypothetical protein AC739_09330 [Planococcus glaciei]
MKPGSSNDHPSNKDSTMDKITKKAKGAFGKDDSHEVGVDGPFQNAPDEGKVDVPKGDKVITDHKTGEKKHIENTGDKY